VKKTQNGDRVKAISKRLLVLMLQNLLPREVPVESLELVQILELGK